MDAFDKTGRGTTRSAIALLAGWLAVVLLGGPCRAEDYPRIPGAYRATHSSPRVFDSPDDLRGMAARIEDKTSFSARMWARLVRQIKADVAAPVDWEATYSGCDIDLYLRAFSFESSGGYAEEQRSDSQIAAALHLRPGLQAPRGAAPVASRLALYAALAKSGAPLPPDAPTADEAGALARRILLAWAGNGFRDGPDRYKQTPEEFCAGDKRDALTQAAVGLQVGRGVIYSVQAQDLLESFGALDSEAAQRLDRFHAAMWTLVRNATNFSAAPALRASERTCEIYSNHRAMHLLALLATARLLGDERGFTQALYDDVKGGPPLSIPLVEYFDHAIYGEHDAPIDCYANPAPDSVSSKPSFQTATVALGEVEDRYRHANVYQGVGYPMFALQSLYFDALVLRNAGLDLFAYRGRHGQSIQAATDYYACYAREVGFDKTINPQDARRCPNNAQYDGQVVSETEKNIVMGAWAYPRDRVLQDLAPAAADRPNGAWLDAIVFGHWPN